MVEWGMEYELAKELKEAGFPQTGRSNWFCGGHTYYDSFPEGEYHEDCAEKEVQTRDDLYCESAGLTAEFPIEVPTLSELIEACGQDFYSLSLDRARAWAVRQYIATGKPLDEDDTLTDYLGKTPEEAVANLYLAIHTPTDKDSV